MNIVIPMAGHGRRFLDAGWEVPKPLIMVDGHPMVWWALQSLPAVAPRNLIFVVRSEHIEAFGIDARLRELFSPDVVILPQGCPSQGQAHTVLLARSEIDNDTPLIIYNCDTYAPGVGLRLLALANEFPETDGFIPVFCSQARNLSYVSTDEWGAVSEVAEKRVISTHATIGLYHFKRGADFVWAADRMITACERVNGEFYVLPAYHYLITERGRTYRIMHTEQTYVLGTPQELHQFTLLRPGLPSPSGPARSLLRSHLSS